MPIVVPSAPATTTTPVGTGLSELVRRVRYLLEDYPIQDQIQAAITNDDDSVTILDRDLWDVGVRLEFDDDTGEQALIGTQSGFDLNTLRRGVYGTTAQAHLAGTYVTREPNYGYQQITEALTAVTKGFLADWVWVRTTATATPSVTEKYYEMPADFAGWISVTQESVDTITVWEYGTRGSLLPVIPKRGLPSSVSTTGMALYIPRLRETTNDLNITYGAKPTATTIADGPMAEAVINGACAWIMGGKGAFRTRQDISQGDQSVAPSSMLQSASYFYGQFLEYRRIARRELENQGALRTT